MGEALLAYAALVLAGFKPWKAENLPKPYRHRTYGRLLVISRLRINASTCRKLLTVPPFPWRVYSWLESTKRPADPSIGSGDRSPVTTVDEDLRHSRAPQQSVSVRLSY